MKSPLLGCKGRLLRPVLRSLFDECFSRPVGNKTVFKKLAPRKCRCKNNEPYKTSRPELGRNNIKEKPSASEGFEFRA